MKINTGCFLNGCKCFDSEDEDGVGVKPEREWQGLTDEELRDAYCEVSGKEWCLGGISNAETFYDVIEAKLKEKNT